MIRWFIVLKFLSFVLCGLAFSMLVPLGLAFADGDSGLTPLLLAVTITASAAALLFGFSKGSDVELRHREGLLLVTATWIVICAFGAIPFGLSPYFHGFTNALFESVSGFTTTGATILTSVEEMPRSLLFWRCFTHWVGGMGIILLGVAILPLIGVGGMELYRAEFSGARSEKLTPRIAETAKALWKIYALLSVLEYLFLRFAGMDWFDSACHTFSTMGTGGFSTRNISIEAFQSAAIEMVLVAFMLLAGINFTIHYRLLVQGSFRRVAADSELRVYLFIAVVATISIACALIGVMNANPLESFRHALFQVASIMTTTGFTSANFEAWPFFAQMILMALMYVGGCAGSTAGGLKTARIAILMKVVGRQFRRVIHRRGVFAVRLSGELVGEAAIQGLLNLVYLAFLVNFAAALVLTGCGADIVTSITAVSACMFNVGPGLGDIGPYDNYAALPEASKWVLMLCMLAGRLEFYTMIVLLIPSFWRK